MLHLLSSLNILLHPLYRSNTTCFSIYHCFPSNIYLHQPHSPSFLRTGTDPQRRIIERADIAPRFHAAIIVTIPAEASTRATLPIRAVQTSVPALNTTRPIGRRRKTRSNTPLTPWSTVQRITPAPAGLRAAVAESAPDTRVPSAAATCPINRHLLTVTQTSLTPVRDLAILVAVPAEPSAGAARTVKWSTGARRSAEAGAIGGGCGYIG